MKKNNYYIKARLFPTILTSIPILTLYYFGFSERVIEFVSFLNDYKWTGDITISIAIIYLLVQINRLISKEIFQNLFFKDELKMPTTNYLLHSDNTLAKTIKNQLCEKIFNDFNIKLLDLNSENTDTNEARKTIVSSVAQIRNVTRENSLLLQHNIEYGFVRNLIGGCVLAIVISIINIYLFKNVILNPIAFKLSLIFIGLYLIPILASKFLINRYGKYYAKILFEQYLKN
jgi:ABC-type multidrug transport system fused ATPase/permease subunit